MGSSKNELVNYIKWKPKTISLSIMSCLTWLVIATFVALTTWRTMYEWRHYISTWIAFAANSYFTNIDYYFFLPSMNHFRFIKFMEIQCNYQLLCPTHFRGLLILIFDIPCHLQSSCICRMGGLNHFL